MYLSENWSHIVTEKPSLSHFRNYFHILKIFAVIFISIFNVETFDTS